MCVDVVTGAISSQNTLWEGSCNVRSLVLCGERIEKSACGAQHTTAKKKKIKGERKKWQRRSGFDGGLKVARNFAHSVKGTLTPRNSGEPIEDERESKMGERRKNRICEKERRSEERKEGNKHAVESEKRGRKTENETRSGV